MKWLQLLDLEIWQEARKLSKEIIFIAKSTKLNRDYKLKEQIKDSSGSVMYTVAERFERNCDLEFRQFSSIAKDSPGETRSQIYPLPDNELQYRRKLKNTTLST